MLVIQMQYKKNSLLSKSDQDSDSARFTDEQFEGFYQQLKPRLNAVRTVLELGPPNPITNKSIQLEPKIVTRHRPVMLQFSKAQKFQKIIQQNSVFTKQIMKWYHQIGRTDSLLHQYKQHMEDVSLIYIKFNNAQYCRVQLNNIKYFSGFFFSVKEFITKGYLNNFFYSNFKNIGILKYYDKVDQIFKFPLPQQLQFTSNFQSANLFAVFRTSQFQYDLILQNDINSKGSTQWFFFGVAGMTKGNLYKFRIVNLTKKNSLFSKGLKPVVVSLVNKNRWTRKGECVYQQTQINKEGSKKNYFSLTISLSTSIQKDYILVAHTYPYTYTKLSHFIESVMKIRAPSLVIKKTLIGYSISNNKIEMLEISSSNTQKSEAIVVMARQHPGQSPASFVVEGLIKSLCQNTKLSIQLRKKYIFYIVPMVNPDGVIYGNYRCNLSGKDLNRVWNLPNKNLHPQVFHLKQKILEISKNAQIKYIFDIHGHSKKLGSFFYSNKQPSQKIKQLPYIGSQISNKIIFSSCTFQNQQFKKTTARMQLATALNSTLVYTFQVSFYGYKTQESLVKPFTISNFKQLGKDLLKTIYQSTNPSLKLKQLSKKIEQESVFQNDSGSDSKPDQFQLTEKQLEMLEQIQEQKTQQIRRLNSPPTNQKFWKSHQVLTRLEGRTTKQRQRQVRRELFSREGRTMKLSQGKFLQQKQPIKNSYQSYRLTNFKALKVLGKGI